MKILNKISDVNDTVSQSIGLATSKKEVIGKQLVNAELLFIILLVFGCLDFAKLEFHFDNLAQASYWGTVFSKTVAGVCAFNIGINIMWESEIKRDAILENSITVYEHLNLYKQDDFEYFVVNVFNPKEKIKAYISQINKKIYKLNKIARRKDVLLYSSELPERQEEKLKNKYCIKRKELENLKDEEFIKKNLDSLEVKYQIVDATVFELEINGDSVSTGVKTKGNVGLGKMKLSSNVILSMIGFSMFFTAVGLDMDQEQFESQMVAFWHYVLKCATDVGIVLWQTYRGMFNCRKIISSELTQPYAGRNKVLKDYYKWRLDEGKITQDDYISIVNFKKEIELEVSPDELKKLQNN